MTLFCNQLPSRDLAYETATTDGGQHLSPRDDRGHNADHKKGVADRSTLNFVLKAPWAQSQLKGYSLAYALSGDLGRGSSKQKAMETPRKTVLQSNASTATND